MQGPRMGRLGKRGGVPHQAATCLVVKLEGAKRVKMPRGKKNDMWSICWGEGHPYHEKGKNSYKVKHQLEEAEAHCRSLQKNARGGKPLRSGRLRKWHTTRTEKAKIQKALRSSGKKTQGGRYRTRWPPGRLSIRPVRKFRRTLARRPEHTRGKRRTDYR